MPYSIRPNQIQPNQNYLKILINKKSISLNYKYFFFPYFIQFILKYKI